MQKIKLPDIANPLFSTTLDIRISDINYGNHLGNDSLVTLLHEARIRFFAHLGMREINSNGIGILVTQLIVNYKNQAFHGEHVIITMGISDLSKTSIDLQYQLSCENPKKEIARALNTITFYDYQKGKVSKIPDGVFKA